MLRSRYHHCRWLKTSLTLARLVEHGDGGFFGSRRYHRLCAARKHHWTHVSKNTPVEPRSDEEIAQDWIDRQQNYLAP